MKIKRILVLTERVWTGEINCEWGRDLFNKVKKEIEDSDLEYKIVNFESSKVIVCDIKGKYYDKIIFWDGDYYHDERICLNPFLLTDGEKCLKIIENDNRAKTYKLNEKTGKYEKTTLLEAKVIMEDQLILKLSGVEKEKNKEQQMDYEFSMKWLALHGKDTLYSHYCYINGKYMSFEEWNNTKILIYKSENIYKNWKGGEEIVCIVSPEEYKSEELDLNNLKWNLEE